MFENNKLFSDGAGSYFMATLEIQFSYIRRGGKKIKPNLRTTLLPFTRVGIVEVIFRGEIEYRPNSEY